MTVTPHLDLTAFHGILMREARAPSAPCRGSMTAIAICHECSR